MVSVLFLPCGNIGVAPPWDSTSRQREKETEMTTATSTRPYALNRDEGIADLWWPFGPVVGRYTIKAAAEQTEGRLIQLVVRDSRGAATPLHIHHDADESFFVIDGAITVHVGDERYEAKSGDFVFAPMGVPHAFVVTSEQAELFVTFAGAGTDGPLGAGVHGFFREVGTPVAADIEPPQPHKPDVAEFARLMAVYGMELVGPPPAS
jgi:mannose-6-phosphate isomerase-like protein (cupin superfamily)